MKMVEIKVPKCLRLLVRKPAKSKEGFDHLIMFLFGKVTEQLISRFQLLRCQFAVFCKDCQLLCSKIYP